MSTAWVEGKLWWWSGDKRPEKFTLDDQEELNEGQGSQGSQTVFEVADTMNGAEVENNKISVSFSGITGFYQPHGLHDEANRAVWLDWWKTGILWTDIKG